jgi:hypothetical protein
VSVKHADIQHKAPEPTDISDPRASFPNAAKVMTAVKIISEAHLKYCP